MQVLLVSRGIGLSGWQPVDSMQIGAGGASECLSRAEGSVAPGGAEPQGWIPAECPLHLRAPVLSSVTELPCSQHPLFPLTALATLSAPLMSLGAQGAGQTSASWLPIPVGGHWT